MDNVIPIGGVTKLDIDPDMMLENTKGSLAGVIVIGWTHDEGEYFASSIADGGDVLWLIERFKKALLEVDSED